MRLRLILIPLAALTAACSFPRETAPDATATGLRAQAYSIADQPCIPTPNSRPSNAPTEFTIAQNSASTGTIFEWRADCGDVRWQLQIVRHDPTDQPLDITITVDARPAYEWLPAAALLNRSYNARVRAAWPDGAVSAWTPFKTFSIGSRPVPPVSPCAPGPGLAACWAE